MAELEASECLLRERGLRVTPQRQAVLSLFLRDPGYHGTANYVRANLCEEIATIPAVPRYGLRLSIHHHSVCDRCGSWYDINVDGWKDCWPEANPPRARFAMLPLLSAAPCSQCHAAASEP